MRISIARDFDEQDVKNGFAKSSDLCVVPGNNGKMIISFYPNNEIPNQVENDIIIKTFETPSINKE